MLILNKCQTGNIENIYSLIANVICFLGEGQDPETLLRLAEHVKSLGLKAALYSGRSEVEPTFWETFDYIKTGPYLPDRGPLNRETTNQRLYRRTGEGWEDITSRFWRKKH